MTGLEPAASNVTGWRSNQLSYTPDFRLILCRPGRTRCRPSHTRDNGTREASRETRRLISLRQVSASLRHEKYSSGFAAKKTGVFPCRSHSSFPGIVRRFSAV